MHNYIPEWLVSDDCLGAGVDLVCTAELCVFTSAGDIVDADEIEVDTSAELFPWLVDLVELESDIVTVPTVVLEEDCVVLSTVGTVSVLLVGGCTTIGSVVQ